MLKRGFDAVVSIAGLTLLIPLMAVIALAILLTDGPPVLFRQRRIGLKGRPFLLNKFRSMRSAPNAEAGSFDAGQTVRVTALGRILRKIKLDELPQLWNVLIADMSLVGPRPEVERWVAADPDRWARVLTVRPGITDPASILYRYEEDILADTVDPNEAYRTAILPRKLDIYIDYVNNQNFWRDITILIQTMSAVLSPSKPPRVPVD